MAFLDNTGQVAVTQDLVVAGTTPCFGGIKLHFFVIIQPGAFYNALFIVMPIFNSEFFVIYLAFNLL